MVATFCLRLACGLVLLFRLLPMAETPPRFFRVHFLTGLGLLAVAGFFLREEATPAFWALLAAGMLCCFLGSVLWHLDAAPGGRFIIWLTPPFLLLALTQDTLDLHYGSEPAGRLAWIIAD